MTASPALVPSVNTGVPSAFVSVTMMDAAFFPFTSAEFFSMPDRFAVLSFTVRVISPYPLIFSTATWSKVTVAALLFTTLGTVMAIFPSAPALTSCFVPAAVTVGFFTDSDAPPKWMVAEVRGSFS